MSELKTNKISTNDQNNVAIDNALGLKSYDTTARDALTSVAGDMIYNTTDAAPQYYNGSEWKSMKDIPSLVVSSLVIAGGAGGGGNGPTGPSGGGGAGGYRNSYSTETSGDNSSTETPLALFSSTNYTVTVGGGGATETSGSNSVFSTITSTGGGTGGRTGNGSTGGSGGGGGMSGNGAAGTPNQGGDGGNGGGSNPWGGGGGGGASANGGNFSGSTAGSGGAGLSSSITGSATDRAGGGGGSAQNGTGGSGGTGGGGNGTNIGTAGVAGTVNTGSGGGGGWAGGAGGSGVVILRYPNDFTISLAGGATSAGGEQTDGSDKYIQIETSGTVSFA